MRGRRKRSRPERRRHSWARVAGAAEWPAGDGWADTVDVGQSATGLGDCVGDLSGQCLEALIGLAGFGDQVSGELPPRHGALGRARVKRDTWLY